MKSWVLVAGVGVLGLAAWFLWLGGYVRDSGQASSSPASKKTEHGLAWPANHSYTYELSWASTQTVKFSSSGGPSQLDAAGDLALNGRFKLRSYGLLGGHWLLAASLPELRTHRFLLNQVDVLPESTASAAFGGRNVLVQLAPDGRIQALYFPKNAPPLFRHLMKTLLLELEVIVPRGNASSYFADEPTTLGLAHVLYQRLDPQFDFTRVRNRYVSLTGLPDLQASVESKGSFKLTPGGQLDELQQHDQVGDKGGQLKAELALHLKLLGEGTEPTASPPTLTTLDLTLPGTLDVSPGSEQALLAQQAAGLNLAELLSALTTFAGSGDMPGKSRFLWRANGLLTLDPEACDALENRFKMADPKVQALILDLLAAAGTPRAQAAMRRALGTPDIQESLAYPVLVQRFSFLQHPDGESASFVDAAYADATRRGLASARYATAYALGATAHHLRLNSDQERADPYANELKKDLVAAKSPDERAQLLTALGAVGRPGDVTTVTSFAQDPEPDVRRAAAGALHDDNTPEGLASLLKLVSDPLPGVQQAALQSLNERALAVTTLESLALIVERNVLHKLSYGDLLSLLGTRLAAGAPVVRMLAFIIAHSDDDPSTLARAQRLLVETGVAVP